MQRDGTVTPTGGADSTRALQEEDLTPRRALQETPVSSASMGGPQYYKLEDADGACSGDSTTEQMPLPQELWTTQDYCSDGGRTVEECAQECYDMAFDTPGCVGFGHGIEVEACPQFSLAGRGKCNFFQNKYCDDNPTWVWHALGAGSSAIETSAPEVSTTTASSNPADSRDPAFAYATSVKVEYTDGRVRLTTFNVSGCNGTRTAEFFPPSGCNMTDPSFKATRLGARIVSTVDPVSHVWMAFYVGAVGPDEGPSCPGEGPRFLQGSEFQGALRRFIGPLSAGLRL